MAASEGCYFRRNDYAPFWRRLIVDFIDFLVVGAVCFALAGALFAGLISKDIFLLLCLGLAFCYFVLLKGSRFRTVGYPVGRVRILGLDGGRARVLPLTVRFVSRAFASLSYCIDLLWMSTDEHRKALRDKFAQTSVIRTGAE